MILPLSAEARFAVGALRLTMLKALVASPRNCNVKRSAKLMLRKIPRSISR